MFTIAADRNTRTVQRDINLTHGSKLRVISGDNDTDWVLIFYGQFALIIDCRLTTADFNAVPRTVNGNITFLLQRNAIADNFRPDRVLINDHITGDINGIIITCNGHPGGLFPGDIHHIGGQRQIIVFTHHLQPGGKIPDMHRPGQGNVAGVTVNFHPGRPVVGI